MKTLLEQELTKEQVEWLKSHADHDEIKKSSSVQELLIGQAQKEKRKERKVSKKHAKVFVNGGCMKMFHTKKQVNDIRNLHIGAGILIYRTSDREVIEEKIVIINNKMINAGSGKQIEFNIIEEEE